MTRGSSSRPAVLTAATGEHGTNSTAAHQQNQADTTTSTTAAPPPLPSPQGTSVVVGIPMRRTVDDPSGAVHDPRLLAGIERAGFFGPRLKGESTWAVSLVQLRMNHPAFL